MANCGCWCFKWSTFIDLNVLSSFWWNKRSWNQILLCWVSSVNYQERQRTQSGAVGLKFDSLISTYNPGQRRDSTQYDRTERIAFVEIDLSTQIASKHDRVNNQARSLTQVKWFCELFFKTSFNASPRPYFLFQMY